MTSGDIQPVWDSVKLADILCRVRKPVQVEPDTLYREIGIRSHGKGIFYKEERTGSSLGDKSVFWIEPDCFVVNIVFAWEQAVAKTTQNELGMIASHRFPMYKPVDGKVDLDYLLYFFKSPLGKYLLGLASPGGAGRNKTLGQKGFLDLSIPLPSLLEQQKITDILITWDKAIALMEQLIAAKQDRKRGLMQQLLSSKRRFKEFEGQDWRQARLEDVCELIRDGTHFSPKSTIGPFRYVTSKNIRFGYMDLVDCGYISEEEHARIHKGCPVEFGDLLLTKDGVNAGNAAVNKLHEPFSLLSSVALIRGDKKEVLNEFLLQYFLSPNGQLYLKGKVVGLAITRLTLTTIQNLKVPIPPLLEQERIVRILGACDTEIDLLAQKLAALKQQKKGLMQQLLTGKVRVKTG